MRKKDVEFFNSTKQLRKQQLSIFYDEKEKFYNNYFKK